MGYPTFGYEIKSYYFGPMWFRCTLSKYTHKEMKTVYRITHRSYW